MGKALSLAAALLLPVAASAQPSLSVRLAYAPALGQLAPRVPISDVVGAQVPVQLDALWRFGPLSAGGYASWGFGQVTQRGCDDGADCSASVLRAGIQATYLLPRPAGVFFPWAGAGLGWERLSERRSRLGRETTHAWSGLEGLLQGGVEWPLGRRITAGPFAAVAIGRYRDVALHTSVESASSEIRAPAVHAWIHLGFRGSVDL
jgi:hypothetical protein